MSTPVHAPQQPVVAPIPPLRQGDHLSDEEFLRRYEAMPEVKKAELIQGVVYMPSPVSMDEHGGPHFDFNTWLGYYRVFTPGTQGGDNTTIRLGPRNVPQPDTLLRILPECGGKTRTVDRYVIHGPELVAEVAASSVSFDLHEKLETYQEAGVQEYIVWRVEDAAIDWFVLQSGAYEKLVLAPAGRYESRVFPGLWLDPTALLRGDMQRVLAVLQEGIASAEHQAFVEKLKAAK
jgi:Uma2 family endonuclease